MKIGSDWRIYFDRYRDHKYDALTDKGLEDVHAGESRFPCRSPARDGGCDFGTRSQSAPGNQSLVSIGVSSRINHSRMERFLPNGALFSSTLT